MKQQQYPLMSIVVLNWNGLKDTKICLEHLRKLDYPNYEIIVVDNGSGLEQKEYLRQLKDIILVDNPTNRGFTGGHIDGFARASGEFIVLLNNDAVMQKDYLKKAWEDMSDPSVAAVGGRSYFWNNEQPILDTTNSFYSFQDINVHTGEAFMAPGDYDKPQLVNNVSGSAVVIRRAVINEVGYLYDRFFAYFEETDLFARIKRAGYKVLYDPRLHIWHRNGASSGASSGSYFFYYRIFRNRFIFAMRNFETRCLPRFCYIYFRIAAGSFLRLLLKRGTNRVMYKAYSKAAGYNLLTFPIALASRWRLRRQLGRSQYNHIIYGEQAGMSLIVDCTKLDPEAVQSLGDKLSSDTNPLHEYILVSSHKEPLDFDRKRPNLRFVVDRGFFAVNPLNIGCLAARFDWMALFSPENLPNVPELEAGMRSTLDRNVELVAFGDKRTCSPNILLNKHFFQLVGGLQELDHNKLIGNLISYAQINKTLRWQHASDRAALTIPILSKSRKKTIAATIKLDQSILANGRVSFFGRFRNKHYRFYQLTTLSRWLFLPDITLYLKAARLKNLLLFGLTLRRKQLALELKHIRNEVILNTSPSNLQRQKRVIKKRLAELLKHPAEIPVFIICRDRVEGLKLLVDWLEKNGLRKIVFIDNDSVYPPLVDYLQNTPYQVLKLYRNVGHTAPWTLALVRTLVPEDFYIITDPDVIPDCPKDVFSYMLGIHKRFPLYQKVGFGLRIDDLPDHYPLKDPVIEWEGQFWKNELAPGIYEAGVDTTFALYKPFTYSYALHPSIRTGFPYVARHLPWYVDPAKISEEEQHYRYRADHNVSSWNADEIEDRYAKEMKKTKKKNK